uniref:LOC785621 protein n=1 Tax=Bos taurus TaxID=9913 RepID=A6QQQ8_BOVIN|nr:LOC785621 protein [Bos taurus]
MKRKWGALLGFLWVQICLVRGVKVEQSPSVLSLQEGANSTLRCNFSDTVDSVQWFQQNPGGSLTRLFFIASGTKKNERMSSTVNSKERYSTLHITASQLEDAATYLCAVEEADGWGKLNFGAGTRVVVTPEVKDPNPTVYQLRSPQSSDTSVCLFTDFDSNQVNMEKIMGSEGSTVHKTNSTVLNMEILGSKSNGIVTWGNTSDAGCEYTFNETIPFASSLEISCNAKLVEKSFETGKEGVHPGFTQVWGNGEPTITQTG